jgi:hypothetical protein
MSDLEPTPTAPQFRAGPATVNPAELDVTWGCALRVWWEVTWRAITIGGIVSGIAGCAIGSVVGFVGVVVHADQATVTGIIALITVPTALILGLIVSVWATRAVLEHPFREFRIALIRR